MNARPSLWSRVEEPLQFGLATLWLGGLTFYSAVVVPIGAQITDATTQGFVTQRVTLWLNVLGAAYLVVNARDAWRAPRRSRQILWFTLAASLLALVILHPLLGRMLDPATRSLVAVDDFYAWHRAYLIVTTVQWGAGVGHVWGSRFRQPDAAAR